MTILRRTASEAFVATQWWAPGFRLVLRRFKWVLNGVLSPLPGPRAGSFGVGVANSVILPQADFGRITLAGSRCGGFAKALHAIAMAFKASSLEDLASLPSMEEYSGARSSTEEALKKFEASNNPEMIELFNQMGSGLSEQEAELWMQANYKRGGKYMVGGSKRYPKWDELKRAFNLADFAFAQAPGARARRTVAADSATREAERALKRAEENQGFITDADRDLGIQRGQFDSMHALNVLNTSPLAGTVSQGADALSAYTHGQKLTGDQSQQLRALTSLLQSLGLNNWSMLRLIEAAHGDATKLAERVRVLESQKNYSTRTQGNG